MIRLESKRLLLREFRKEDICRLHEICNEEHIKKWLPDWNVSLEVRKDWFHWIKNMYAESRNEDVRIMLAIELKNRNELIGMIGIGNKEEVDHEVEVAYFITDSMSGNGYVTEALSIMKDWALEYFDLPYLIAIVEPDNTPSKNVLEKNGFRLLGDKRLLNSGETEIKSFHYYRYESHVKI